MLRVSSLQFPQWGPGPRRLVPQNHPPDGAGLFTDRTRDGSAAPARHPPGLLRELLLAALGVCESVSLGSGGSLMGEATAEGGTGMLCAHPRSSPPICLWDPAGVVKGTPGSCPVWMEWLDSGCSRNEPGPFRTRAPGLRGGDRQVAGPFLLLQPLCRCDKGGPLFAGPAAIAGPLGSSGAPESFQPRNGLRCLCALLLSAG